MTEDDKGSIFSTIFIYNGESEVVGEVQREPRRRPEMEVFGKRRERPEGAREVKRTAKALAAATT